METLDQKVAKRLRYFLKTKKKTAEKLAYEIDMSKGYLSNFLTGRKGMSLATLQRIADGLEVKVEEFFVPAKTRK